MSEPELKKITKMNDDSHVMVSVTDSSKDGMRASSPEENYNLTAEENRNNSRQIHDHQGYSNPAADLENANNSNKESSKVMHSVVITTPTPDDIKGYEIVDSIYTDSMERKRFSSESNSQYEFDEDTDHITLQYTRHERIPMKDFSAEHRAISDVEKFVSHSYILLGLNESSLDRILDAMLKAVLGAETTEKAMESAKGALFTHDNAHLLCRTIQGTAISGYGGAIDYDQSWICVLVSLASVQTRSVCIARLAAPSNLGRTSQEVYFVILVITPIKEKTTKSALEVGRTFATLFSNIELRGRLLVTHTVEEFKNCMWEASKATAVAQSAKDYGMFSLHNLAHAPGITQKKWGFCKGILHDVKRRVKFYTSDYKDAFFGYKSVSKTISTTLFLYFAILLPSIALGSLNDLNLDGEIGVKHVLYAQTLGGIYFALIGGQPMVILMTTAPLAIYSKVIFNVSKDFGVSFAAMYACTGLWNSFFLIVYSVCEASRLMKWCSRSTEEIFALFIAIAFTVDAMKDVVKDFNLHYVPCLSDDADKVNKTPITAALNGSQTLMSTAAPVTTNWMSNVTSEIESIKEEPSFCSMETSLLFLLLVLGTLWLGLYLFNFQQTPFLNAAKREILSDYALAVAVLVMSFFGSFVFKAVVQRSFSYRPDQPVFEPTDLTSLTPIAVLVSCGLGFCLSLLFFMDQNISASLVNSPDNKLKKGTAYHWDLLVVAVLNGFLTMFKMPMMHGALPHSPLHVRSMADLEDRVDDGHVYQHIIRVRENRVTALVSHILIGLSLFLLPSPLQYIPLSVLNGLFLYLAITSLNHNQMWERITLFFTEQAAYPPNHYIRTVPQRKVHTFTLIQMLELGVLCAFGFSPIPYMKMCFPILMLLMLPIRHNVIPVAVPKKYLKSLDC